MVIGPDSHFFVFGGRGGVWGVAVQVVPVRRAGIPMGDLAEQLRARSPGRECCSPPLGVGWWGGLWFGVGVVCVLVLLGGVGVVGCVWVCGMGWDLCGGVFGWGWGKKKKTMGWRPVLLPKKPLSPEGAGGPSFPPPPPLPETGPNNIPDWLSDHHVRHSERPTTSQPWSRPILIMFCGPVNLGAFGFTSLADLAPTRFTPTSFGLT